MRFIKCNRCGKLKRDSIKKSKGWIEGIVFSDSTDVHFRFDLCHFCSPKLVNFLKKYLGPVSKKIVKKIS
ncbi:hypothetical protein KKG58_05250 [Patescibacteria group bacterium]|nr:hypothetical protein [Patescibacteria group bacterium]